MEGAGAHAGAPLRQGEALRLSQGPTCVSARSAGRGGTEAAPLPPPPWGATTRRAHPYSGSSPVPFQKNRVPSASGTLR